MMKKHFIIRLTVISLSIPLYQIFWVMFYSDEETRKFEESFQEKLKAVRNITPEQQEKMNEAMNTKNGILAKILSKQPEEMTETDKNALSEAGKILPRLIQAIEDTRLILGESLRRDAYSIYQHIKKQAEEGDPNAIEANNNLKPSYEAAMLEDLQGRLQ